jgi:hypothetical protein
MERVYQVTKCNKTKYVSVGDFETLQQAEAEMIKHYKNNSKRGSFYYSINTMEVMHVSGLTAYSFTFGDPNRYSKRYSPAAIENLKAEA